MSYGIVKFASVGEKLLYLRLSEYFIGHGGQVDKNIVASLGVYPDGACSTLGDTLVSYEEDDIVAQTRGFSMRIPMCCIANLPEETLEVYIQANGSVQIDGLIIYSNAVRGSTLPLQGVFTVQHFPYEAMKPLWRAILVWKKLIGAR